MLKNYQILSVFLEQFYFKFISDPELLGSRSGMIFQIRSLQKFRIRFRLQNPLS
jgi:hypothetical protein